MINIAPLIVQYREKIEAAASRGNSMLTSELLGEYLSLIRSSELNSIEIGEYLHEVYLKKDWSSGSFWLSAAYHCPSMEYLNDLCGILTLNDPNALNEAVVDVLYKLRDPKTLPFLANIIKLESPNDPGHHLAIACLDVLAAIDSTESYAIIQQQLAHPDGHVRNIAGELIDRKGSS